ncbi:hypothetical protein BU15DRAFT_61925 [Melanogaster broomeanus]|nr:hypothetical protein BU15DRAFT_61925 [Melanogaster broomeanus]
MVRSAASAWLPDMSGMLPGISGAYPMHPMGPIGLVRSCLESSATTWWNGGVVGRFGRFIGGVDGSANIFGASPRDSRPALLVAPSSPLARPSRPLPSALLWLPRPRSTGFACLLRPILQPPSALLSPPVLAALLYGHSVILLLDWDCSPSHCTLAGPPAVLGALVRWSRRHIAARWLMASLPLERHARGAVWRASTWVFDDSLWDSRAAVRCAAVPFVHAAGPFCSRAASFAVRTCVVPLAYGGVALEATGMFLRQWVRFEVMGPILRWWDRPRHAGSAFEVMGRF